MTDDWEDYDSGSFCPHWARAGDCEEACARCGHPCPRHDYGECSEEGCGCASFVDPTNENAADPEGPAAP